jgi:peptide/nickel transport system substrate-binding protein
MGEAAARDVAFRNKEIDVSILGPTQYVAYKADANLKKGILEVAEVFTRNMGMNPNFKPFSDKRVRQAINHAIDSESDHQAPGAQQGLSRHRLAAALLAGLRQGDEAL